MAVTFELAGCLDPVEVFNVRLFGLDVAYDMLFAVPDLEVGVPRLGLLWKGSYVDFGKTGLFLHIHRAVRKGGRKNSPLGHHRGLRYRGALSDKCSAWCLRRISFSGFLPEMRLFAMKIWYL